MLKIKGPNSPNRSPKSRSKRRRTTVCPINPEAIDSRGRSGFVGPENALTVTPFYFNNRAASIYGGSNEIQRNIIAKAVLGLTPALGGKS